MEVSSLISLFPAPVLPLPTLSEEVGQLDLVVSPLALAGFLGLHFTEMTILPVGVLETDQIVTGGVGYRCAAHISTGFSFLVMAVLFLTTSKDSHEWFTPHQHLLMTSSS
jgi:hypothetical protein